MGRNTIAELASRDGPVHRLDPRTKLVAALCFVAAVLLTRPGNWPVLATYLVLVSSLLLVARLPLLAVVKRSLAVETTVLIIVAFTPFFRGGELAFSFNVLGWQVSVSQAGLTVFWNTLAKAWLSILCLIALTSTTPFWRLLMAMERLKVPRALVMVLSFMYRCIFILEEEASRMGQAREGRNFGRRRAYQLRTVGHMAGTLFIRAFERGERVYAAMLSRGFDGETRSLHRLAFTRADGWCGAAVLGVLAAALLFNLKL